MKDLSAEVETARKLAQRGAELGKDDPVALAASAIALAFVVGELDHSRELIDQALSLDPNLAWGWLFSAWVNIWSGEPEEGIKQVEHAMRLSPHDPHVFNMQSALALAHFLAGRYDEALSWARIALRAHHHPPLAAGVAAASAAYLGKEEEAHEEMSRLLKLNPGLCLSNLKQLFPCRRPEHYAIWADGLRKAGLPE